MDRKKKIAAIAAGILVLYSLTGFIVIPLVLESVLSDKLSKALNRQVTIENISLNPFSLSVTVNGFNIQDKNQTDRFVSFDELYTNVQASSLFRLGLVVKEFRLEKPDIRLVRVSETGFNFSDLIPEKKPEEITEKQETKEKPFQFAVSNIAITNGNVSLEDKLVQKQHAFSNINLKLPRISNFDAYIETFTAPQLTGNFNQAGLSVDMETKPFHNTLETILHLSLKDFNIPYYFSYVPENLIGFDIRNGRLNIDARVSHINKDNQPEIVVQGKIILSDLEIFEKNNEKLFTMPNLQIEVAPSHPLKNELKLASVKLTSPELTVTRNPEGIINLTTLGPRPSQPDDPSGEAPETPEEKNAPEEKAFRFDLASLVLASGKVVFKDYAAPSGAGSQDSAQDKTVPTELSVDDLNLTVSDFSTTKDHIAGYKIQAKINKEADMSATGGLGITPLKVESDFSLSGLKLSWGQPYMPDTVRLGIVDGRFTGAGHADVHTGDDGEINATVTCNAAVNGFKAVDLLHKETFLAWQTFSFDGIDVSVNPLKITTDKILLKDFKNQVIILNDGTLNIDTIFLPSEPAGDSADKPSGASQAKAEEPVIPVRINQVLLDNFDFRFKDTNIKPHFSTRFNLSELRITGLTSEDFKAADITGKGKIDEYAPVTIKGSVNPLQQDLFLDLTYSLKNMEMGPLSPYTGKYIGRMIEKGKLSTDIEYKINRKTINARNKILLDQFTLGQKVDSKDAVNLPIGLAIALLKDRDGEINIDLPISGRTDDPDFRYGKTVLKALANLIVKAAASPFSIVGSIVGSGEELRFIEFNPADASINTAAAEKLDTVKKLMYERPGLTLEIAGYVDMNLDRESLKDRMLARKVKMLKVKKGAAQDMAAIDAMVPAPEEYADLLKKVFKEEVLSDPEKKKTLKTEKDGDLTIQEMEALIRQGIDITDAELHLLALERAREVKNYLLQDETITADRLFMIEPETLSPEGESSEFQAARAELNVR